MSKFESKNTILTKKLNNVIYELLVKTSSDMVYTDDTNTLTETLSDITDTLTTHNQSFEDVIDKMNELVKGADDLSASIKEIWSYINVDGDPKSALIKMIESKQDSEEGKGLSECDFTEILKEKLVNGYSKEELDEKFTIIIDAINNAVPEALVERVESLENRVNIQTTASDKDLTGFVDGSIWYQIVTN